MNGVSPGGATPPFGEGGPRDWLCIGLTRIRVGPALSSFWRELQVEERFTFPPLCGG